MHSVDGMDSKSRAVGGGAVAGVIGGVVLALILAMFSTSAGQGIWPALKGGAAPFLGAARVAQPGFDPPAVVLGLFAHFAVSIIWGILFGLAVYGLPRGATIIAGVIWGLVVWIAMYFVVLPIVGLATMASTTPLGPAVLAHFAFGVAVALGFLPYQHTIATPTPPGAQAAY